MRKSILVLTALACAGVMTWSIPKVHAAEAPVAVPAWETDLRQKLQRKVSFDFKDTPLSQVLTFLSTLTKVNMFIAQQCSEQGKKPITLKVQDVPLETALTTALKQVGLFYQFRKQAVFVTDADLPADKPPQVITDEKLKAALAKKVTFNFADMPVPDVAVFLANLAKIEIKLTPEAATRDSKVSLRVSEMTVDLALQWVVRLADLDYRVEKGIIVIDVPKAAAPAAEKK